MSILEPCTYLRNCPYGEAPLHCRWAKSFFTPHGQRRRSDEYSLRNSGRVNSPNFWNSENIFTQTWRCLWQRMVVWGKRANVTRTNTDKVAVIAPRGRGSGQVCVVVLRGLLGEIRHQREGTNGRSLQPLSDFIHFPPWSGPVPRPSCLFHCLLVPRAPLPLSSVERKKGLHFFEKSRPFIENV